MTLYLIGAFISFCIAIVLITIVEITNKESSKAKITGDDIGFLLFIIIVFTALSWLTLVIIVLVSSTIYLTHKFKTKSKETNAN